MNGHIKIDIDVAWRDKDWGLLQFDSFQLANDASDLRLDVPGNGLQVHRLTWRPKHGGGPLAQHPLGLFT
jgi:hypothetical protein